MGQAAQVRLRDAGRRLVLARYTWPAIVEALTGEYEAVIARTKAGRDPAPVATEKGS